MLRYFAEYGIVLQDSAAFIFPPCAGEGCSIENALLYEYLSVPVDLYYRFSCVVHSLACVPFLWMGHSAQGSGYWKDWKK